MTQKDTADRLLTQAEFADFRRCSIRTIERERAVGTGCAYVRLGARIFYRLADIDRFVDAHRIGGSDLPNGSRTAVAGEDPTTDMPPSSTSGQRRPKHTAAVVS
jgi:hypothetical protein